MKKIYSLFILSILALTMFVGCQMPTDDVKDILNTTYRVSVTENTYKDNVSVDKVTPKAEDKVVLTIKVPDGFSAEDLDLLVELNDTTIEPDNEESTETNKVKKSFIMPASDVVVTVNFEKKATQTDDTDNVDDTQIETPNETEYTITVNAPHGTVELDKTKAKAGETVKLTNLKADDGYTLKTMSIKKENGEDVTEFDRKNQSFTMPNCNVTVTVEFKDISSGGDTSTYTVSVPSENYITSSGSSYGLAIQNAPIDGYKKDDKVEILITNGNFDVNTGYGTPNGLYLVKVSIREGNTDLDIPVIVTKDHKIQFTMPEKNINVFAQFCDIRYQKTYVDGYKAIVNNYSDNKVTAVLCFNKKVYDNLEEVDEKYVLKVGDLEKGNDTCTSMYFTSLCDNNLSTDGTLNDNQYTFGVIVNNELKILKKSLSSFSYNPNEGLQSK